MTVHHATQTAMDNGWATTCGRFITTYVDRCSSDWREVTCRWCLRRAVYPLPLPTTHGTTKEE